VEVDEARGSNEDRAPAEADSDSNAYAGQDGNEFASGNSDSACEYPGTAVAGAGVWDKDVDPEAVARGRNGPLEGSPTTICKGKPRVR